MKISYLAIPINAKGGLLPNVNSGAKDDIQACEDWAINHLTENVATSKVAIFQLAETAERDTPPVTLVPAEASKEKPSMVHHSV